MPKKKALEPKKMNTDSKTQEPLREAVEKQLASVQAAQAQTEALVPAVRAVEVRNSRGEGTRTLYKDAENKFISQSKARAMLAAQTTQKSLEKRDPETKKTEQQLMEERLIHLVKNATDDSLGGATKAFETLMARAHGKIRNSPLEEDKGKQVPITVVINASPHLKTMSEAEFAAILNPPTKPSWVDAEIVEQNPPEGLDKV